MSCVTVYCRIWNFQCMVKQFLNSVWNLWYPEISRSRWVLSASAFGTKNLSNNCLLSAAHGIEIETLMYNYWNKQNYLKYRDLAALGRVNRNKGQLFGWLCCLSSTEISRFLKNSFNSKNLKNVYLDNSWRVVSLCYCEDTNRWR